MASTQSALLILTTDLISNPDAIGRIKAQLADYDVHQQLLDRLTEKAVNIPVGKFSKIYVSGGSLTSDVADTLYAALKEGGSLYGELGAESKAPLVIAGFVNEDGSWIKKPAVPAQAAALPVRRANGNANSTKKKLPMFQRASKVDIVDEDDDGLIDEDDLISNDIAPAYNFPPKCDPGPGKKRRRACKDCTCGLKDAEEREEKILREKQSAVLLNHDEIAEIDFTVPGKAVGGCGSCSLGDAFRCDGCPYLGLPPFRPGEVVTVDQFGDDF